MIMSFNVQNLSSEFWSALGQEEIPEGTEQELDDLLVSKIVTCTTLQLKNAMEHLSDEDTDEFGAQCTLVLFALGRTFDPEN